MKEDIRVLVVDDSEDAASTLATYLQTNGYEVKTAAEGAEALGMVRDFLPQCVLLDVNMPGMDGMELARHMKAQFGDDIVLIAVTGAPLEDARVETTFSIVDHYLQKPVDLSKLDKLLPRLA